jgi:hypothetical protein
VAAVESFVSIRASDVTEENWLPHLIQCRDNGTLARITDAQETGAAVLVKRSDGSMQLCQIVGWGFGCRLWDVAWGEGDERRYKHVELEKLLEWNPSLDASVEPAAPPAVGSGEPVQPRSAATTFAVEIRERPDPDVFWTNDEVADAVRSGRITIDNGRAVETADDDEYPF